MNSVVGIAFSLHADQSLLAFPPFRGLLETFLFLENSPDLSAEFVVLCGIGFLHYLPQELLQALSQLCQTVRHGAPRRESLGEIASQPRLACSDGDHIAAQDHTSPFFERPRNSFVEEYQDAPEQIFGKSVAFPGNAGNV